jgi:hypothetical protein
MFQLLNFHALSSLEELQIEPMQITQKMQHSEV